MRSDSIKSFIFSLVIHLMALAVLVLENLNRQEIPQVSLVLEARIISDMAKNGKDKKVLHKEMRRDETSANKHHVYAEQDSPAKMVAPIYQPLPEIPEDLRFEAFNSSAVARFYIAKDGSVSDVKLIKPCANPRLNHLLLKSLRNWKFDSSLKVFIQDIRVNFKVIE
ncbi:MAG: hypothetical protein A2887_00420 [Alphaproteobacteria bacterium RIFCSPLOWO2_01_FULL_40_26]|nr:MAG: hypothetical protein A3D15_00790 [Alphaproteobacteria bacterium RIFCSPHIGHO2_02_FULL_40_34]OFW85997.1 MAG: hypothetical protein A2794_02805 [Alphaproteobacteria bacterium RIFCSPHIGHO2_01_FULL_40_8]OFW94652.1 MAG: hypothetical protein A2887_00420 [Alphaproteobacteria bacterium RIFCSPLOWO2_01_FULL_40_26]OFX10120.1 MAG: hypothetical protein A3H30_04880 [Alphaproteobacteria bacterium RIFCSPLOWO2_02_FULL_40_19]OFX11749.1 MAG: hypothetical protein A3G22_04470 [Alphaproteobacteria bacterium RI